MVIIPVMIPDLLKLYKNFENVLDECIEKHKPIIVDLDGVDFPAICIKLIDKILQKVENYHIEARIKISDKEKSKIFANYLKVLMHPFQGPQKTENDYYIYIEPI